MSHVPVWHKAFLCCCPVRYQGQTPRQKAPSDECQTSWVPHRLMLHILQFPRIFQVLRDSIRVFRFSCQWWRCVQRQNTPMYSWTTPGHESGQHKWIYSPQGRTLTLDLFFWNTMMIHTSCLSVPQQNPPVVLRIPSHELFESIKGISLNRLCLKIALLLPLDSVWWMIDSGFYPVYPGCLLVLKQKWGYS